MAFEGKYDTLRIHCYTGGKLLLSSQGRQGGYFRSFLASSAALLWQGLVAANTTTNYWTTYRPEVATQINNACLQSIL